jgi:hypothetical protein
MDRGDWPKATLGGLARAGHPIAIWCNDRVCPYWIEHGQQYRTVLSVADLVALAERYGDGMTLIDFRVRLRCRHCGSGDVSTIVDWPYKGPMERP